MSRYELASLDGAALPAWTAGAHIDVVVAPEYLRQYSLCGDPADRSRYKIGVLREPHGQGGSKLLHRIFVKGRRIFVSKPINHFALEPSATRTLLMGGGIGVTPMIAMAHELHAAGAEFALHYSARSRRTVGFLKELAEVAWSPRVDLHFSDERTRADLDAILCGYEKGAHVYVCGPDAYMQAVLEVAERSGFPDEARHMEYFTVPEIPDYVNHPFTLKLARSGLEPSVPVDKTAADVLNENGVHVDIKCSDGLCGVCRCGVVAGRWNTATLCCRNLNGTQRSFSVSLGQCRRMV